MTGQVRKEPLSKIHQDHDGRILFVPTEDMWIVHEQSRPAAVALRAGLQPRTWDHWKYEYQAKPWLFDWLYLHSDALPKTSSPEANGFKPTKAMHAFRQQSSIVAIAKASARSKEQLQTSWQEPYNDHVTKQLIWSWRRRYQFYPWFERWLLRGEDPAGITIASLDQIRRCSAAWNFAWICRQCRPPIDPGTTYCSWIKSARIPNASWLFFLYGGPPPDGAFVVPPGLQRLRSTTSKVEICRAAGLGLNDLLRWESDPEITAALAVAIKVANKSGPNPRPPEGLEAWDKVHSRTKKNIWKYARESRLSACCERAGVKKSYHDFLQIAERCGVKSELADYLNRCGQYPGTKNQVSGLVAPNFFIPSDAMRRFRVAALKVWTEQNISALRRLPCFEKWFVDWAVPGVMDGRRITLGSDEAAPMAARVTTMRAVGSLPAPNGQADQQTSVKKPEAPAQKIPPNGQSVKTPTTEEITLTLAAKMSAINRGIIWRAAKKGEIANNGKAGRAFRLELQSFNAWLLERAKEPEREESQAAVESKVKEQVPDNKD